MIHTLAKILVAPLVWVLTLAGYNVTPQTIVVGSDNTNAVGGESYTLSGSGISSSGTSLTLTSFTIPGGDTKITMTDFGDLGCATLEPGSKSRQEFISFTGVTQNSDGTASISGITRGLSPLAPYTASTTLQQSHAGGSSFVISNSPPCFYENYTQKDNDDTITGLWNFALIPYSYDTATSTYQFATRAYADSIAVAGAATTTTNTSGIGVLATGAVAAAGTYTLEFPRLLGTNISTSTYFGSGNNQIIVTKTNGSQANTIDPNFIATSSNYTFGGQVNLSASSTIASTTISSLIVQDVISAPVLDKILATTTNSSIVASSIASTTMLTFTIPANTLKTSNAIHGRINVSNVAIAGQAGAGLHIEMKYGATSLFTYSTTTSADTLGGRGSIDFTIYSSGATNTQEGDMDVSLFFNGSASQCLDCVERQVKTGTSAIDSTADQTFSIVARFPAGAAGNILTITDAFIYAIK